MCFFQSYSQNVNLKFSRFSIENGLSQNTVNSIIQDSKGFIWMGTQDGLNRYDGYEFRHYHNEPGNTNSLSNNFIEIIFEDQLGNIWVGTRYGLNKFDPVTGIFTRFHHDQEDSTTISSNRIRSINQEKNGTLWVGTIDGLNRYDSSTNRFIRFINDSLDDKSISNNYIRNIYIDIDNTMWIGTSGGLNKFNKKTDGFVKYNYNKENSHSISGNVVNFTFQDRGGVFWVGTSEGLNKFNPELEEFTSYQHDSENENTLSNSRVQSMIEDKSGIFWIGTVNGLNKLDPKTNTITKYKNSLNNPKSISGNYLNCIIQDNSGMIWIGTQETGLNKFNPNQKKFNHFKTPIEVVGKFSGNYIWSIREDNNGNVWYGTNNGLYVYDPNNKRFRLFQKNDKNKALGLLGKTVYSLLFDKYNNLWIGTGGGLSRLNSTYINKIWDVNSSVKFVHFSKDENNLKGYTGQGVSTIYGEKDRDVIWVGTFNFGLYKIKNISASDDVKDLEITVYSPKSGDSNSISNAWINTITRDFNNNLWIGTEMGLDLMDEEKGIFQHYNPKNSSSVISVSCIYPTAENVLWLGTYGGGLNKFNIKEGTFTSYTIKDGLPNNYIYGVLVDSHNELWLSSNNGVSKFNTVSETFRNYNTDDGLQSNEFNTGAFYKSQSGKLYFGGINGFNSFYPDSIKDNKLFPAVYFTELNVFNKSVNIGLTNKELGISKDNKVLLNNSITATNEIQLSYKHHTFSIEFSALHFQAPNQNLYAYQLVGFDNDWVYTSADNRRATYTNLEPNTYTFKVKASNSDGVWNELGRSIIIVIDPPFWKTWWFYTLCVVCVLAIIVIIFKVRLNQQLLIRRNDEKTAMMKEIHHRVKNNLQIVNSLLKLQSYEIKDKRVVAMFEEAQDRVISMALIHEKMYRSDDLENIDIREHFNLLINDLVTNYAVGKEIQLDIKVEKVDFGIKTLVPLGLIINELITNSLKYAFNDRKEGIIKVHLRSLGKKKYELIIGDNGFWLNKNSHSDGIGMELVQIFTEQLEGKKERLDSPGTNFKIVFENIDNI